ncbi:MAG: site-2 protease family protein [Clostridia bacterium]|nr:site-2 protease family protein [Clostridia bacterium]
MLSILAAILLLGILVTVHEFGHFLAARACGIAVREYSIGFGPQLFHRTGKKGTVFSLRLIPMGGFCAFYGEDTTDEKALADPRAFSTQAVWKRMITVLMGPGMNFILAFAVLFFYVWIGGTTSTVPVITAVEENSPAMEAGLEAGDQVLAIDGIDLTDASLESFTEAIGHYQEGSSPLVLSVVRGSGELELQLTPFWDDALSRYRFGISVSTVARTTTDADGRVHVLTRPASIPTAASIAWNNCVYAGSAMLTALKNLVTRGEGLDQTSGPVGIVSLVSSEVRTGGMDAFINLLILISINLGIMNLLPIPGLDGSRFLFQLLEVIRRKPIPPEKEAVVHLAGFVLLFGLMIFFTYRDIMNLIH